MNKFLQWNAVDGLQLVHKRLRRVVIFNRPAIDVIKSQDSVDTFFYLDPPYMHETRVSTDLYSYEMTDDDHKKLLDLLVNLKGKFMLSGYDNDLYNEYERKYRWNTQIFDLPNNAAKGSSKRRMIEKIWMNY